MKDSIKTRWDSINSEKTDEDKIQKRSLQRLSLEKGLYFQNKAMQALRVGT